MPECINTSELSEKVSDVREATEDEKKDLFELSEKIEKLFDGVPPNICASVLLKKACILYANHNLSIDNIINFITAQWKYLEETL